MIESKVKAIGEKALAAVNEYGLDGINVLFEGWSGSAQGGKDKAVNANYITCPNELCKQLNEDLTDKTLSINVKGDNDTWSTWGTQYSYNGDFSMFDNIDYINVQIYSFTGSWSSSPVAQHSSYEQFLGAIKQWTEVNKIDKSKLILGLPAYGLVFQSATSPVGAKHTAFKTILSTYASYDPYNKDNFTTSDGKVVFYNGKPLITKKAEYVRDNDFGGVMLYEMSEDSSDKATSLLNVIANVFSTGE